VGSHNSYELLCLLPTVIRPIAVHTYISELFITVGVKTADASLLGVSDVVVGSKPFQ
jgi:hypothetical protein